MRNGKMQSHYDRFQCTRNKLVESIRSLKGNKIATNVKANLLRGLCFVLCQ